jgi:hypothetical protein
LNLKQRIEKLEKLITSIHENEFLHRFIPALFYCGWLKNQTEEQILLKNQVQSCHPYCCFNHMIGLPTIKYEDESGNVFGASDGVPLWPYEKEIIDRYENIHYYALNKCRGAGATELLSIRYMAFKYITTRIKDRKCLLIAGTNQDAAKVIMRRIKEICDKVSFVYRISPKSETPGEIYFQFGMILSIPANPDDIRSYENVGDVILEESAFWKLIDDSPVLLAAEPHVAKSSAHIGVISTPNGRSGFFWNKIFDPEFQTKYDGHVLNWREVVDVPIPVISKEEILLTKEGDPSTYDQEFDNQFIISENRAFGDFDTADFMPIDLDKDNYE